VFLLPSGFLFPQAEKTIEAIINVRNRCFIICCLLIICIYGLILNIGM
jgi:hypothetical protein